MKKTVVIRFFLNFAEHICWLTTNLFFEDGQKSTAYPYKPPGQKRSTKTESKGPNIPNGKGMTQFGSNME